MKRAAIILLALCVAKIAVAQPAPANSIDCLKTGEELQPLPEAKYDRTTGILKATLGTTALQVRMTSGSFGDAPTPPNAPMGSPCYPQWVRGYRLGDMLTTPQAPKTLDNPLPGPVFRAVLGGMVQLTFLNLIDRNKFPNSDKGCDKTSNYPGQEGPGKVPDKYPNCFSLSTSTNIHYHGSHTNPGSTGDNVFVTIQPSPRSQDATRAPLVTPETVRPAFADFFTKCERELPADSAPKQWPRFWDDLPATTQTLLQSLVQDNAPDDWKKNEALIKQGHWPQFYVGAYPYCFRLPRYTQSAWPPAADAVPHSAHVDGAGSAEIDEAKQPHRPLIMGQAPGTHWYHAHKHGSTTINVLNGMTGVFIVEDPTPTGYDGWIAAQYKSSGGIREKVLVINQLGTTPPLERSGGGGRLGPHFSVNGRLQPKITMRGGEVQLWRIANTSSRAGVHFVAPTGISWKQTAQDGVQFDNTNYTAAGNLNMALTLASGNRADLLVKAPVLPAGTKSATYQVVVMNTVDQTQLPPYTPHADFETLLTVVVTAKGPKMQFMASAPPMPPYLTNITDDEIKGTKTLVFASTSQIPQSAQHTIDGKKFDGDVGSAVRLNKVEEWKIINETYVPNQIAHPFHIHINPFQISAKFDPNAALSSKMGAGTVTMQQGSMTVTVSGATFDGVQPGDFIWINGLKPSTVLTVAADKMSLTVNKTGKALSGVTYTTAVPQYTINASTARPGQCVISPTDDTTWKPCFESEPPAGRIWWDVFPIPSGNIFYGADGKEYKVPGWFKMRSRFVDYAGYFVLHCHILAHEDRGMMTVVEVTPLQSPYSHH